jgi:hypothetical protein
MNVVPTCTINGAAMIINRQNENENCQPLTS